VRCTQSGTSHSWLRSGRRLGYPNSVSAENPLLAVLLTALMSALSAAASRTRYQSGCWDLGRSGTNCEYCRNDHVAIPVEHRGLASRAGGRADAGPRMIDDCGFRLGRECGHLLEAVLHGWRRRPAVRMADATIPLSATAAGRPSLKAGR
jgi:hypothetical protein